MIRMNSLRLSLVVAILWLFGSAHSSAWSQCTFNCNDTVNVSVNNMCMAIITADLVLEDPSIDPTCYAIELFDAQGVQLNSQNVGKDHIGQYITVKIIEANPAPGANANSCWGVVLVEDKLPPGIVCTPRDTIPCDQDEIGATTASLVAFLKNRIETNLIDNCGNEEVDIQIVSSDLESPSCDGIFAARRIVVYKVFDNGNNVTSCVDTILYERVPIDGITPPRHYSGTMSLKCTDPEPTVSYLLSRFGDVSVPNINGKAIAEINDSTTIQTGLCNYKLSWRDTKFEHCGSTFKIVRTWTVIDWCASSQPIVFNQIIKVIDDNINIVSPSCVNITGLVASTSDCMAVASILRPTVSQTECNTWTWQVFIAEPGSSEYLAYGGNRSMNSPSTNRRFALGVSMVRIVVTDACGNQDMCTYTVEVVDEAPPVPVCDSRTVVVLNDSFLGKVFARSFDDGSYDACSGIASYKVRRMDRATTQCPTPSDWDDFVKFCCADIGQVVRVEFQVTDSVGLTATCMAEAIVQFKGDGPNITCPSSTVQADCRDYDAYDINILTPPTITSSNPCIQANLTPSARIMDRAIDDCGVGFIDISYFINITGTEEVICTRRVEFTNQQPFTESMITWPADKTVMGCMDAPPTQAELDALVPDGLQCSNVLASEPSDDRFENVSNACVRIRRTWTVVDWCRYPADRSAIFTYIQTITVNNTTAPSNVSGTIDIIANAANCRATVTATGNAVDDCNDVSELIWTYQLNLVSGTASIPLTGVTSGRTFTRTLDAGNYLINWTVEDECNNQSTGTSTFAITDDQAPEAMCNSFAVDVDSVTNTVVVTASQINNGSTDNCDAQPTIGIRIEGSNTQPQSSLTFDCQQLGVNNIELIVTDDAGNVGRCVAMVDVRDGLAACGFGSSAWTVEGRVTTVNGEAVELAEVKLSDMTSQHEQKYMTPADGNYAFGQVIGHNNYELKPYKNDDAANGISTIDLILLQRHILGIQDLTSPYQLIAADANGSQSITSADIIALKRIVLGISSEFTSNTAWRFIPEGYQFFDPGSPWDFDESLIIDAIDQDVEGNFTAIKIGDIDHSAIANSLMAGARSEQVVKWNISSVSDGLFVTYTMSPAKDMIVSGLQLAFEYSDDLMYVGAQSHALPVQEGDMVHSTGRLRVAHATPKSKKVAAGTPVFQVRFIIEDRNMDLNSAFSIDDEMMTSEVYDEAIVAHRLHMEWHTEAQDDIHLLQNRPNPFADFTTIEFILARSEKMSFRVYNLNGSQVFAIERTFVKGVNQIELSKSALGINKGIYYYQLEGQDRSLTRKMIVL